MQQSETFSYSTSTAVREPSYYVPSLGLLNVYFLIKWLFWWAGIIDYHPLENLAFAALVVAPLAPIHLHRLRNVSVFPLGLLLFYFDSWLPPLTRLMTLSDEVGGFSFTYVMELIQRFVNLELMAGSLVIVVIYLYLSLWIRVTTFVFIGLIVAIWLHPAVNQELKMAETAKAKTIDETTAGNLAENLGNSSAELNRGLTEFYQREAERRVSFTSPLTSAVPFDVLLLNVCSLSWDDLAFTGQLDHPLFKQFDLLFENFSSAASYSGPAAIRLLRASCGQPAHTGLYENVPDNCSLFKALEQVGFTQQWIMNHDGHYDDFAKQVVQFGKLDTPLMDTSKIPVAQLSFDGSPIHSDAATLAYWLEQRKSLGAKRTITFYNTVSLHDGNRFTGQRESLNSLENFHPRLIQLLDDLSKFFQRLQESGGNYVVILVPEHGAAVRGDQMQIAGLREIPTPSIARVPVGVKLIGPTWQKSADTIKVSRAVSFLAISHLLSQMLVTNPFEDSAVLPAMVESVPETSFVAENEGAIVVKQGGNYYLRLSGDEWIEYKVGR